MKKPENFVRCIHISLCLRCCPGRYEEISLQVSLDAHILVEEEQVSVALANRGKGHGQGSPAHRALLESEVEPRAKGVVRLNGRAHAQESAIELDGVLEH